MYDHLRLLFRNVGFTDNANEHHRDDKIRHELLLSLFNLAPSPVPQLAAFSCSCLGPFPPCPNAFQI